MSRYIDADALKDDLVHNRCFYPAIVDSAIRNTPTAEVVEVRHGYWKSYLSPVSLSGDLYYKCSVCGAKDPYQYTTRAHPKYCPDCGAKMDGERR